MSNTSRVKLPRLQPEELLCAVEKFAKQNSRLPKTNSTDPVERSLARRLTIAKSSGRLSREQLNRADSLLKEYGSKRQSRLLPTMSPEELLKAVENFVNHEQRMPSTRSQEQREAALGRRLARMKNKKKFSADQLEHINELMRSCPGHKEPVLPRLRPNELLNAIEEFTRTHGRLPRHASGNAEEECLYNRFCLARRDNRFTPVQKERAIQLMREFGSYRTEGEKLQELLDFCEKNDRWPRTNSLDPTERRLAGLGARKAFRKKLNPTQQEKLDAAISKYKRRFADANEAYEALVTFVQETGTWPRSTSENPQERWLYRQYQAKTQKGLFSDEQAHELTRLRMTLFLGNA